MVAITMGKTCFRTRVSHASIRLPLISLGEEGSLVRENRVTLLEVEDSEETGHRVTASHNIRLGVICLLFVLVSCTGNEVYYLYHHIDKGRWHRENIVAFHIDSGQILPGKQYSFTIELSSNRSYPYRDLWLGVGHNLTDTLFHVDTLRVMLMDEQGKWIGSGVGGLNQFSVPYLLNLSPVARDSVTGYTIWIKQVMGDNPLHGVEKVGLKVEDETTLK